MCVLNESNENTNYRCGMCEECIREIRAEREKEKEETLPCKNCGWCEECCPNAHG